MSPFAPSLLRAFLAISMLHAGYLCMCIILMSLINHFYVRGKSRSAVHCSDPFVIPCSRLMAQLQEKMHRESGGLRPGSLHQPFPLLSTCANGYCGIYNCMASSFFFHCIPPPTHLDVQIHVNYCRKTLSCKFIESYTNYSAVFWMMKLL